MLLRTSKNTFLCSHLSRRLHKVNTCCENLTTELNETFNRTSFATHPFKTRGWRSFSSCVLDCIIKCLFEFTCLCNGVGGNIGFQTGTNDSLKIYKGEQSPDIILQQIHLYCFCDYPWTMVWEGTRSCSILVWSETRIHSHDLLIHSLVLVATMFFCFCFFK